MQIEYDTRMLVIDETLPKELEKLTAEGWQIVNGTKPVAIYSLGRVKGQHAAAQGGEMKLTIDESKVFIRGKDGQIRQ